MQQQTTTQLRPQPEPRRAVERAENLILAAAGAAVLLVLAFADTAAAGAYRQLIASILAGG